MPPMELAGRTVLLTGASGGIGRAIARALHRRGASLVVTARRSEVLVDLQRELGGERVEPVAADLSDRDDLARLAARSTEVDVLVANAALPASGRVEGFSPAEIDRALDVNLRAPIQLARALVPPMLERRSGHLVFISSLAGKVATARSALYSATKFGVRAFAAGLREDLHGSGVGVTTVFPGFISDAGLFAGSGVELPRGVGTRTPDEVANAVLRGIEEGKPEIDVAPLGLRAGALFSAVAPNLAAPVQRRLGSTAIADAIAEGQADKR
jgi:short-subunit dehydrogenase